MPGAHLNQSLPFCTLLRSLCLLIEFDALRVGFHVSGIASLGSPAAGF